MYPKPGDEAIVIEVKRPVHFFYVSCEDLGVTLKTIPKENNNGCRHHDMKKYNKPLFQIRSPGDGNLRDVKDERGRWPT